MIGVCKYKPGVYLIRVYARYLLTKHRYRSVHRAPRQLGHRSTPTTTSKQKLSRVRALREYCTSRNGLASPATREVRVARSQNLKQGAGIEPAAARPPAPPGGVSTPPARA